TNNHFRFRFCGFSSARAHLRTSTVRECLSRDIPAAGGTLGALFHNQTLVGTEQLGTSPVYSTTPAVAAIDDQWTECPVLLNNDSTDPVVALTHGYSEMDRLLNLLPPVGQEHGLHVDLGSAVSHPEDWSWLNESAF
ncbi:hypothetical protein M408DRAFT_31122, partial [Serendipita vermifera MAFF 305830]